MRMTEEKLQHLQEITGLRAGQAREALEQTQGDELEALEWLEQRGRIASAGLGYYSTAEKETQEAERLLPVMRRRSSRRVSDTPLSWGEKIWMFLVGNRLAAWNTKNQNQRFECPLGALLTLLVIAWYVVAAVLVLGWVLGWRYRMEGPQLGPEALRALLRRVFQLLHRLRRKGRK